MMIKYDHAIGTKKRAVNESITSACYMHSLASFSSYPFFGNRGLLFTNYSDIVMMFDNTNKELKSYNDLKNNLKYLPYFCWRRFLVLLVESALFSHFWL